MAMKRIFKYMIMSAAAVVVASCAKEVVEATRPAEGNETVGGEGVTFTAYIEDDAPVPSSSGTKVAIGIDEASGKAKVSFTAGDFVAIYDGETIDRITLNAENINPDGSATFKAPKVSATAESYLAYVSDKNTLGSFEENHVYTNVKNTGNPNDFVEIASGRTPHAAFASCGGTDRRLSFKNMLTLLKFKVSTEGVSYVEFRGNNNENVTGKVVGTYSTGETNLVGFNTETNCFAVAKTFVSAPNTDCYITLAPGLTLSKGFMVTAYDAAGSALFSSKSDKVFTTAAGKLWDLGTLEEHKMTPYEMWMAGQDIEIGGKMYNKAEYGAGKLVKSGASENLNAAGGVYFIENGATINISWSTYKGAVILIGNDKERGNVKFLHGGDFYLAEGEELSHHVIAFKNVNISNDDTGRRPINGAPTLNRIVFDGCKIYANNAFIHRQTNTQLLADMTIVNSDIAVLNDNACMIQFWNGTGYSLGTLTVKNNVFWTENEHNIFFITDAIYGNGGAFTDVVVENNTFYNVDNGGKSIWYNRVMVTASGITGKLSIKNNLSYTSAPKAKNDDIQRFFGYFVAKAATFDSIAATVSDNWSDYPQTLLYKGSDKSETVNYIKGYDYDYTNNVVKSFTNPFESFDVTTGAFRMKSGYTNYGAQR